jgi:hypothetical protein
MLEGGKPNMLNSLAGSWMSAEAFFRAALDADVTDDAARLLFGEMLASRGDWRAAGYRWMASHRKEPSRTSRTTDWWHELTVNRREIVLPDAIWSGLDAEPHDQFPACKEFASLADAEQALCEVVRSLKQEA